MLRALLHGKLGGFGLDAAPAEEVFDEDEVEEQPAEAGADVAALARDEDSLSATVFGRIAYLPSSLAWDLLHGAFEVHHGEPPPRLDRGFSATFWKKFTPHPNDSGRYVEPDLVLGGGDDAIVIEVKWLGVHGAHQCLRQLRSVARRWPGARLWMVLVGRRLRESLVVREVVAAILAGVTAAEPLAGLVTIDWADLAGAVRALRARRDNDPHIERVVIDLDEALRWRGLREPVELRTLPRPGLRWGAYATLIPDLPTRTLPPLWRANLTGRSAHILSRW